MPAMVSSSRSDSGVGDADLGSPWQGAEGHSFRCVLLLDVASWLTCEVTLVAILSTSPLDTFAATDSRVVTTSLRPSEPQAGVQSRTRRQNNDLAMTVW